METPSGAKLPQKFQAIVQRIAIGGDQIPGHHRYVGSSFIRHIDGALQLGAAQKRTEMDVRQLHQTQSVQFRREVGDLDLLLAQVQLMALDENAISEHGRRRGEHSGIGGLEEMPPRGAVSRSHARTDPQREAAGQPAQREHSPGDRQPSPPQPSLQRLSARRADVVAKVNLPVFAHLVAHSGRW